MFAFAIALVLSVIAFFVFGMLPVFQVLKRVKKLPGQDRMRRLIAFAFDFCKGLAVFAVVRPETWSSIFVVVHQVFGIAVFEKLPMIHELGWASAFALLLGHGYSITTNQQTYPSALPLLGAFVILSPIPAALGTLIFFYVWWARSDRTFAIACSALFAGFSDLVFYPAGLHTFILFGIVFLVLLTYDSDIDEWLKRRAQF